MIFSRLLLASRIFAYPILRHMKLMRFTMTNTNLWLGQVTDFDAFAATWDGQTYQL